MTSTFKAENYALIVSEFEEKVRKRCADPSFMLKVALQMDVKVYEQCVPGKPWVRFKPDITSITEKPRFGSLARVSTYEKNKEPEEYLTFLIGRPRV